MAKRSFSRWVMSLVCVLGMVSTWVMTAFFVQGLQDKNSVHYYPKPFFINYFVTSGYSLLLLVFFPGRWYQRKLHKQDAENIIKRYGGDVHHPIPNSNAVSGGGSSGLSATDLHGIAVNVKVSRQEQEMATEELKKAVAWLEEPFITKAHKRLLLISSLLMIVYMGSGYLWYVSLPRTPLSANTVIYNSACVIVFCLSIVILGEKVSILKVGSVALALIGVICVALLGGSEDDDESGSELLGYVCVFISVFLYAVYQVLFKALSGDDDVETEVVTVVQPPPQSYGTNAVDAGSSSTATALMLEEDTQTIEVKLTSDVEDGVRSDDDKEEEDAILDEDFVDEMEDQVDQEMLDSDLDEEEESNQDALGEILSCAFVLGCIGVTNILFMWPFIILVDFIGVEPWMTPNRYQTEQLFLNLFLSTSLNSFLLVGILFTTPLFMSIGQLLTIPAAVLVDALVKGEYMTPGQGLGALSLVIGFVGLNVSEVLTGKDEEFQQQSITFIWKEHHVNVGIVTRIMRAFVGCLTCRDCRRYLRHKRGFYTQRDSLRSSQNGSQRKSARRGSLENDHIVAQ